MHGSTEKIGYPPANEVTRPWRRYASGTVQLSEVK